MLGRVSSSLETELSRPRGLPLPRLSRCAARYALASFSRFRTSSCFHSSFPSLSRPAGGLKAEEGRRRVEWLRSLLLPRRPADLLRSLRLGGRFSLLPLSAGRLSGSFAEEAGLAGAVAATAFFSMGVAFSELTVFSATAFFSPSFNAEAAGIAAVVLASALSFFSAASFSADFLSTTFRSRSLSTSFVLTSFLTVTFLSISILSTFFSTTLSISIQSTSLLSAPFRSVSRLSDRAGERVRSRRGRARSRDLLLSRLGDLARDRLRRRRMERAGDTSRPLSRLSEPTCLELLRAVRLAERALERLRSRRRDRLLSLRSSRRSSRRSPRARDLLLSLRSSRRSILARDRLRSRYPRLSRLLLGEFDLRSLRRLSSACEVREWRLWSLSRLRPRSRPPSLPRLRSLSWLRGLVDTPLSFSLSFSFSFTFSFSLSRSDARMGLRGRLESSREAAVAAVSFLMATSLLFGSGLDSELVFSSLTALGSGLGVGVGGFGTSTITFMSLIVLDSSFGASSFGAGVSGFFTSGANFGSLGALRSDLGVDVGGFFASGANLISDLGAGVDGFLASKFTLTSAVESLRTKMADAGFAFLGGGASVSSTSSSGCLGVSVVLSRSRSSIACASKRSSSSLDSAFLDRSPFSRRPSSLEFFFLSCSRSESRWRSRSRSRSRSLSRSLSWCRDRSR